MIVFDFMGHMVSTTSSMELHDFAARLGLKMKWYQTPEKMPNMHPEWHDHYDLTTFQMRTKAKKWGAKEVTPKELLKLAWWNRRKRET